MAAVKTVGGLQQAVRWTRIRTHRAKYLGDTDFVHEEEYGGRVIAPGTGFLLNDEMHDFNINPGVTDAKGSVGTKPNLIEPGKRMLSSMSPMIILKDGKPFLVTGSPGGRTIINTMLQVIVNGSTSRWIFKLQSMSHASIINGCRTR